METIKAKHTVGDAIHVKLFYQDGRCTMTHYGEVMGAHLHHGSLFPDRVLYDISLEQADGPRIRITDLPHGFVLAGGPEIEEEKNEVLAEAERRFPLAENDPTNRYDSHFNANQLEKRQIFLDGIAFQRDL